MERDSTSKNFGHVTSPIQINGRPVVCDGKWLRVARIHDEIWNDGVSELSPAVAIQSLKQSSLKADVFTFAQTIPATNPKHAFHTEWDSLAVADTTDFKAWWESMPQESRKNTRRSQRRGVTVRVVEFNDDLVRGIKAIYDETPVRQGRLFWHYNKDFEAVKRENATYLERSEFIGAFHGEELIGFIKMVYVGQTARIMQIISKNAHYDKRPTNCLLAKAVEICSQKGVSGLIYGQFIYGSKASSSVTEFKRRNGFHEVLLPRYYIPLTMKGRLAIAMKLHRGIKNLLPEAVLNFLLRLRTKFYERRLSRSDSSAPSNRSSATQPGDDAVTEAQ